MEIIEDYGDYLPRCNVLKVTQSLLTIVPREQLTGLQSIILKNSTAGSRKERRRVPSERRGAYFRAWQNRAAYIELYVDHIIGDDPVFLSRIPLYCDILLGDVLFHEIGHHLHAQRYPEYEDREVVAKKWSKKLLGIYLRYI